MLSNTDNRKAMKNFEQYLAGIKLPAYILFKNLKFEHDFDIDASIARGEIIETRDTYYELKEKIPKPKFPEDEYKVSLLDSKYGQINENELEYDDTIFDICEGEPSDFEIFGESYTIVLVCPPDESIILKYLVEQYKKERDLLNIWISYLDRLHIFPFYSLEITSDNFTENLSEDFQNKVKQLPLPPTEEEWDELKEYL